MVLVKARNIASCYSSDSRIEDAGPCRKFFVVILFCLMGIGIRMILEIPLSLRDAIIEEMKIKSAQFEMHFHLQVFSCTVSWVSGFIIDEYLDLRLATVIFLTTACVGNALYAIGAVTKIYTTMLIGWLITGLGVKISYVCISCYTFRWFPKKCTHTVFAIYKSVTLIGRRLIFAISSRLMSQISSTSEKSLAFPITISIVMCFILIPLICAVILALITKQKSSNKDSTSQLQNNTTKIAQILKIPLNFWILSISVNIFFSTSYVFLRLNVLGSKYGLSLKQVEMLTNGFTIGACIMGPIIGLIVDWKGRNMTFITVTFIGGTIAHFSFVFTITDPFYPVILLSFSLALVFGSYWPLYTLILKKNEITLALVLDECIFNLCLAVGYAFTPQLLPHSKSAPPIYLLVLMAFTVIGSCILWGWDCTENAYNQPKTKRVRRSRRGFDTDYGILAAEEISLLKTPNKFITSKNNREVKQPRKPESEFTYVRLSLFKAESYLANHQRVKSQSKRMMVRQKSKSYEDLPMFSQV